MKKVYFACAVSGGRDYTFVYKDMVRAMKSAGATVHGELFADPNLKAGVGTKDPPDFIWKRDIGWLRESDAFIAEASQPSLGVGYEIALAESMDKPVLVLFYKNAVNRFSPMVSGNPNIETFTYANHDEAKKAIKKFIKKMS